MLMLLQILLVPLLSQAADPSPSLSRPQREALYEETGMQYAKGLYLENNGTP